MKIKSILILSILLISFFSFSQNGVKNFIDQPFIEITGTSEIEITPNEIYVKITLNESDKRGNKSIEELEREMISRLKSIGVDADNCLTILDFDGYYQRKFLSENKVVNRKSYQLIVNSGKSLGNVYQVLDALKISNVSIIKTSHTEIEKIKRNLKINAIKVAKEKATDYCIALDQTLGKAIYISENQFTHYNNISNEINVTAYGNDSYKLRKENYDLGFSKINLKAAVNVKFILN